MNTQTEDRLAAIMKHNLPVTYNEAAKLRAQRVSIIRLDSYDVFFAPRKAVEKMKRREEYQERQLRKEAERTFVMCL